MFNFRLRRYLYHRTFQYTLELNLSTQHGTWNMERAQHTQNGSDKHTYKTIELSFAICDEGRISNDANLHWNFN